MIAFVPRTFLLTWNPRIYAWKDLRRDIRRLRRKGKLLVDWSCARSKQIRKGDRLYLLRVGVPPRGIVASGTAADDWYEGPSWRKTGGPCHYVDVELDVLLDAEREPILPRALLDHGKLAEMYWNTMVSGVEIPEPVARELHRLWRRLTG